MKMKTKTGNKPRRKYTVSCAKILITRAKNSPFPGRGQLKTSTVYVTLFF